MKNKDLLTLAAILVLIVMLLTGCGSNPGDDISASGTTASPEVGVTAPQLDQALSSGKPTLVELGSNSCAPCRQMKPILEQLSVDYEDRLNVLIIDVNDNPELAQKYKVLAIPTQVIFNSSGEEISRHVGLWPREQIEAELNKLGIK